MINGFFTTKSSRRKINILIKLFVSSCLCGIIISCSGSKSEHPSSLSLKPKYKYMPTAVMTNEMLSSADKDLSIKLPNDWTEVVAEKNTPNVILWIAKEDYSASISFMPITMDPALYTSLSRDGLRAVANVSLSMKRDRINDSLLITSPVESFEMNGRQFYSFEYSFDKGRTTVRVIVFDTGRKFLECIALPSRDNFTASETYQLFEIQQSVLNSMTLR